MGVGKGKSNVAIIANIYYFLFVPCIDRVNFPLCKRKFIRYQAGQDRATYMTMNNDFIKP